MFAAAFLFLSLKQNLEKKRSNLCVSNFHFNFSQSELGRRTFLPIAKNADLLTFRSTYRPYDAAGKQFVTLLVEKKFAAGVGEISHFPLEKAGNR